MAQKEVKIQKDGIVKVVLERDVKDYVALGWQVVQENPFYNNNNNYVKR